MFLFAMWWDSSDRARLTRRSDVAFWLHLLAAPMIAHPIFTLLGPQQRHGRRSAKRSWSSGFTSLLGLTALAIDRRALLVSALAYVLFALTELFKRFGAVELNVALTALVIGSALLLLSAFWHQARRRSSRRCRRTFRSGCRTSTGRWSLPNQPHKAALERGQHARKLMAPLQQNAMLTDQRERPLLQTKRGAFLDADFGALGVAAIGGEDSDIGVDPQRIIAPVSGGDHPAVEVEDPRQLPAIESRDWAPVP